MPYFVTFSLTNKTTSGSQDELSGWWSNLLSVAALWLLGEDEDAEKLYPAVELMPQQLLNGSDALPRAILAAFKIKRVLMYGII